jgi:hypothetical protein
MMAAAKNIPLSKMVAALNKYGSTKKAGPFLGIDSATLGRKLRAAEADGKFDYTKWLSDKKQSEVSRSAVLAADRIARKAESAKVGAALRNAENENALLKKELAAIKIIQESSAGVEAPEWCLRKHQAGGLTGVPTLFLSDLHWGEVVNPQEIGGVNQYNLKTANARLKQVVQTTVDLCKTYIAKPNYPGIVVPLGGDIFSGDIHEELSDTNELPLMPTFLDAQAALMAALTTLADEFGKVFVPVVVGNHGRTTRKPRCKSAVHTNFDWLLGKQLEMALKHDKRITFRVSESLDTQYRIYGTRYNLTHGDQFNGGSGIAGILSPLMLGDHRKRKRQMAVGQPYDYMVCGHWHSLFNGRGIIINGSLKGYDEYAYKMNFQFEEPGQALWITHPDHGMTYWMPVVLRDKPKSDHSWVSIPEASR